MNSETPQIKISSLTTISKAAKEFIELTKGYSLITFEAPMGSGKTTFIQAILKELGIEKTDGSPTFGFVNTYESAIFGTINHLDLYRLSDETEALNIGIEELIYSQNLCFIEWPEVIRNLMPSKCVRVTIAIAENNERIVELTYEN